MVYILMGVSGAGKTLIGQKLSDKLDIPFYDGDNFHPPENVEKMKSGRPLNDEDRKPWLEMLAQKIHSWNQDGDAILACSALKKRYRDLLKNQSSKDEVIFIHLKGPQSLIAQRIAGRSDHFMPQDLLDSQFKTLEEPDQCITVSVNQSPDEIVESIIMGIKEIKS